MHVLSGKLRCATINIPFSTTIISWECPCESYALFIFMSESNLERYGTVSKVLFKRWGNQSHLGVTSRYLRTYSIGDSLRDWVTDMKVFLTWPAELCAAFIKTFHHFGHIWLGCICLVHLYHDGYPNDYNGFRIFVPQRYFVDIRLSHSIIIIKIIFSLLYFYSVSLNLKPVALT